jgi:hypothetical protein
VEINFPEVLINVVMHAVTSVITNVKWNGVEQSILNQEVVDTLILQLQAVTDIPVFVCSVYG